MLETSRKYILVDLAGPGLGDAPLIWVRVSGVISARFPGKGRIERWLKRSCGIHEPQWDGEYWNLPKNSLGKVFRGCLDAFGCVRIYRDTDVMVTTKCDKRCQEAYGPDCVCSCRGEEHGAAGISGQWQEVGETKLTQLRNGRQRFMRMVYPPLTVGVPRTYEGELRGEEYTPDPRKRRHWPKASEFLCARCLTQRARVWDHCHSHMDVRAPLCNKCNTWNWRGWKEYGRTPADTVVDMDYYKACSGWGTHNYADVCSG